jgi:hypothetical protein
MHAFVCASDCAVRGKTVNPRRGIHIAQMAFVGGALVAWSVCAHNYNTNLRQLKMIADLQNKREQLEEQQADSLSLGVAQQIAEQSQNAEQALRAKLEAEAIAHIEAQAKQSK